MRKSLIKKVNWSLKLFYYLYGREDYKKVFNKRKDKEWDDYIESITTKKQEYDRSEER